MTLAASLAWVHEHIAAFGGDPERITVVGESAGADNAIHLAISPLSQGRVRGTDSAKWRVVFR